MPKVWKFGLFLTIASLIAPASALAEKVQVSTLTASGSFVHSRIMHKAKDGEWEEIPADRDKENEVYVFQLSECDLETRISVAPAFSTHTRNVKNYKPCSLPKMVFDDFVPTAYAATYGGLLDTSSALWQRIENAGYANNTKLQSFSELALTAAEKGEYGKISLISLEIATSLEDAGQKDIASEFRALSLDASIIGIARKSITVKGLEALQFTDSAFAYSNSSVELTDKTKTMVEDYQLQHLKGVVQASRYGSLNWVTNKTLGGYAPGVTNGWKGLVVDDKLY